MRRIFLIRHAESTKNIHEQFSDPSIQFHLTEQGKQQALEVAQILSKSLQGYDQKEIVVVTNQEKRTLQSAQIISGELKVTLVITKELMPMDSGHLRGMSEASAKIEYPELMDKMEMYKRGLLDGYDIAYPGGDNVEEFQNRVIKEFFSILKQHQQEVIVMIAHRSTITAILSFYKSQLERKRFYYRFKLDLSGISEIEVSDENLTLIKYVNRTSVILQNRWNR